ncbi:MULTISPECIES: transcriptional regulator [Sorangium]|uniref:transcriptional regulator n=1 Tax=Sorangium TaxID=39643 RepID=UPI003D9C2E2B
MSVVQLRPNPGKGSGAPKGRHGSVCLTREESAALRAALQNLNRTRTWAEIAREIGVCTNTVRHAGTGRSPGSAGLALRVARLAGLGLERILNPGPVSSMACPACGRSG